MLLEYYCVLILQKKSQLNNDILLEYEKASRTSKSSKEKILTSL